MTASEAREAAAWCEREAGSFARWHATDPDCGFSVSAKSLRRAAHALDREADRIEQATQTDFTACQKAIAAEERGEGADEQADGERQMLEALNRIARQHHTDHCIARQAWGDGECECKLDAYADGIDAAAVEREAIRSRVNAAVAAGRHFAIDGEQLLLVRQVIDLIGGGDGR